MPREVSRPAVVATVAVLVATSLVSVTQCVDVSSRATTATWPATRRHEDAAGGDVVEEQLCGDVVHTDRVHVPAVTDRHHRLLQLHVRTNLQVRRHRQSGPIYTARYDATRRITMTG